MPNFFLLFCKEDDRRKGNTNMKKVKYRILAITLIHLLLISLVFPPANFQRRHNSINLVK